MPKPVQPSTRVLQSALDDFLDRFGLRRKLREYDAVTQWNMLVGEQIARVTSAVKIEQGILTVRVGNGPWRNELVLRKTELMKKINDALGETIVRDIRFV